jgi:serine/threonine protein kinase
MQHVIRFQWSLRPPEISNFTIAPKKPQRGSHPQPNRCFDSESKLRWVSNSQTPNLKEVPASLRASSFPNLQSEICIQEILALFLSQSRLSGKPAVSPMNESHQREAAIFDEACELPPAERAAYLDHACAGDPALRQRIAALLQVGESGSEFLDAPADPALTPPTITLSLAFEKAGDRIGRYKLLQQIGEGGCGVVYMAEQEEPVTRRVALKIIKLGMDTKSVIARFEAERQALALMDHPNIAKVLDAGATETGRPYFVMELVRGMKITDFCDEKKLPTRERLNLFIQVCQAIQHAHQKGIIHRDIKPSNILVTVNDGVAVPKVIDFGIAKATTGQKLTDKTLFTAFEQFIGTPAYMSPEQAVLTSVDIDTRSDIYALGVLLYELLTGKTPFDAKELLAIGLDGMRRTIQEKEPQRPSTRINTLSGPELSTTAQRRGLDPPKLVSELRGDLDLIVMKALEKDRMRRYSTASLLAADIQHHLSDQPVAARPQSTAYRLRKFVRRNQAMVVAGATALVLALGALLIGMRISERKVTGRVAAAESESVKQDTNVLGPALVNVSGAVISEKTGRPLSGARVRIASPARDMRQARDGTEEVIELLTDGEGGFAARIPDYGTYSVDAFLPGYRSAAGTLAAWNHLASKLSTSERTKVTIKLQPALYASGITVDEDGVPVSGVEVVARIYTARTYQDISRTRTGSNGEFEIFNYPPTRPEEAQGQISFLNEGMLRSFVPDIYKLSEAEQKKLKVVMRRGYRISGKLISASGWPVQQTLIEAEPSDPEAQYKEQLTDKEGHFALRGLPEGTITLRVHSFRLEQKAQIVIQIAGADSTQDLRLEPIILKEPQRTVRVLGMKLANITPELQRAYDLSAGSGVLIVDPGENTERLGIGSPQEGQYFFMVGNKWVATLKEMVSELLRINQIPQSLDAGDGEGHRGFVRVIYSGRHWNHTRYLKPTDEDAAELAELGTRL